MLLITLGAILILNPLTRSICYRLGIPSSVGYIVLGMLIGWLVRLLTEPSSDFDAVFTALANLGVVALLFRVGLRSHTSTLLQKLPSASVIWISNVVASLLVGYAVSHYAIGWSVATSLVIAVAFSATSVAVSVSVWDELGKLGSDQGQMLIDVAELDDLSAAILLAVLVGIVPSLLNGDDGLWQQIGISSAAMLIRLVLFISACYLFAHYLEQRFTDFNSRLSSGESALTISILGAGMVIAALADSLGFSIAIGALFAGLAFSRDPQAVHTDGRFRYIYDLLTPFFFVHIGMQTEFLALLGSLHIGLLLFIAASLVKVVSTSLPALLSMPGRDAYILGLSMVPRAEIALVVMYACRALNPELVSQQVFSSMVLVSLATCIISPILLRRMLAQTGT